MVFNPIIASAYEALFLQAEVAEEPCRGQFRGRNVKMLKPQRLLAHPLHAPDRERDDDSVLTILWRYELDGHPGAEIFEFTTFVDRSMLARVVEHAVGVWCLLYDELREAGRDASPLVTATVVYHGKDPWTVPRSTTDGLPALFRLIGLQMEYKVIDVLHDPVELYSDAPLMQYMIRLARAKDRKHARKLLQEILGYYDEHCKSEPQAGPSG